MVLTLGLLTVKRLERGQHLKTHRLLSELITITSYPIMSLVLSMMHSLLQKTKSRLPVVVLQVLEEKN